jgi:hypothetical protein
MNHIQAVETIKQASVLVEAYLDATRRLRGCSKIDLEGLLLGMDQNYAASWAKMDEAREQLRLCKINTSRYDELRQQVNDALLGYQEEHQVLAGHFYRSRWWVEKPQVELMASALQTQQEMLPGTDWAHHDDEVEKYLEQQKNGRQRWKFVIYGTFFFMIVAMMYIVLCGGAT